MQKNIKTAIEITDVLIEAHMRNANGIQNLVKEWKDDGPKSLALKIAEVHDDVAKCLLFLKKTLEKKPKCSHPKKMQDTCKGQRYCMNCNEDLD